MQLNELAEFHKNCLKKLPYRSYLYHIPRRIRPVRRLSAHLCRNGRRVGVEKLFFKSFIWMMRWNFLQKKYLYDGVYKVDLFRSNSFMALFEFSTDALFIDYLLYWRLSEIEPLFKVVLKKYRKKEPTPELYFLFPQERIYTTYKWASAYVQMRNYSLKKIFCYSSSV